MELERSRLSIPSALGPPKGGFCVCVCVWLHACLSLYALP